MPKATFHNLPDAKRRRIVDAALQEFSEVAFEAASLSRIVRRAGIAKGSFYQYFDDLFDLFRWVVLEHLAREKMRFVLEEHGPAPEGADLFDQIAWTALGGIRWGLAQPQVAACGRQIWTHSAFGPVFELQREMDRIAATQMRHVLVAGQAQGVVRPDIDLDAATALLVSMRTILDAAITRRFGVSTMELCMDPERAAGVDTEELHQVVLGVTGLLRAALGTGASGGDLALTETPYARHLRGEP